MTEKPALPIFNEVFGDLLRPAPQPAPEPAQTIGEEANAKLKRNLDMALDVHQQAMSATLPDVPVGEKRLMVESAHMTVKAALTTDKTALKARSDNVLERVLLRCLFAAHRRGRTLNEADRERIKNAPRKDLEAALSPRQLAEYDRTEW